jgi:hypothetical protein
MKRLPIMLSATALMLALLGSTSVGHAAALNEPVPSEEYVPFVTDFPEPAAGTATPEPFVPFVTDFPKPAGAPVPPAAPTTPSPTPKASASGIDWGDAGIGSGVGAALAALLAGSALVLTRRARPARS